MATPIDALLAAESQLNRSFLAAAVSFGASLLWTLSAARGPDGALVSVWPAVALLLVQIACYIWYAIAAGAAARLLGGPGPLYIAWILVAPFLGLLPIPIVSTIIGVSPLSIRFLLGGQLQSAIREQGVAELHGS